MIPFGIDFIRPESAEEAVAAFTELTAQGRTPRYFAGGTELVTAARDGRARYDALIDLKRIPETTILESDGLAFGSCLRLGEVVDALAAAPEPGAVADLRGALAATASGIADRTTRNSITLGGNICGLLPYREAVLPFLVAGCEVEIAGPRGRRREPLPEVFDKRLQLGSGEFVLAFHGDPTAAGQSIYYGRHARDSRVDYPLVSLCAVLAGDRIRAAVSGAFAAPVLIEVKISSDETAVDEAASAAGATFRSDHRASADYRRALLAASLEDGSRALEEQT